MSEKIKVESSNLEFVEYIADKKELRIWFLNEKDVIYAYANVTQKIYDELINASSIGGFFTKHIKYKFQFRKEMESQNMEPSWTLSERMFNPPGSLEPCYHQKDVQQKIAELVIRIEDNNRPIREVAKEIFGELLCQKKAQ